MPSADDVLSDSQDAFDNFVSDRTNVLDLAAHYPYSPERWRLFVDGSRIFPEYETTIDDLAQYTHDADSHDLSPAAGETVTLESAERPRYVVQYELAATWAFALNQSLSDGDRIRIGLYDGADGWYLEQRGADHADDEADLVCERDGSEVYSEGAVDLHVATTRFARLKLTTGWYRVTRQAWERSFSNDGAQENVTVGGQGVSADDGDGPVTGNLPIHFEVTADASTSGLVLEAGSAAQVNLGTTRSFLRQKTAEFETTISTTGSWVPIHAFRIAPDRRIIATQVTNVDIVEFSGSGDVRIMPMAMALEKLADSGSNPLDDSDFSPPAEHAAANSVIETTDAVAEFPDSTGSLVTSATNPGGYQLGYGSWHASGTGSQSQVASGSRTKKRTVPRDDICVFLARADTTGDVTVEWISEQDW